jgi:hypothetical protein
LEHRIRHERARATRAEQDRERVALALLLGEKVCIRCWQAEADHEKPPGPPDPPPSPKAFACNDFLELTAERLEAGDGTETFA